MSRGMHRGQPSACLVLACALAASTPLQAQPVRDPTVPPAAMAPSAPGDAARPLTIESGAVSMLVREGVPYLVVGTRLYAQGQSVGPARIERISETEVWLREDGMLRKVPVFGGIERRINTPQLPVKKPTSSARKAAPKKP